MAGDTELILERFLERFLEIWGISSRCPSRRLPAGKTILAL
jgi:hypothetical protein